MAVVYAFQVVPPCGGHQAMAGMLPPDDLFQVVPPCGGHHMRSSATATLVSFKSCPRVGGIAGAG